MEHRNLPVEVVFVILASVGGVARYLSNYIKGEKFRLSMLVSNFILSGFAGLRFPLGLSGLLCQDQRTTPRGSRPGYCRG